MTPLEEKMRLDIREALSLLGPAPPSLPEVYEAVSILRRAIDRTSPRARRTFRKTEPSELIPGGSK